MSGVAKDDINPTVPDETVSAVGDAEAGAIESPAAELTPAEITAAEIETRARRSAPHLRVVTDEDAADFVAADPEPEAAPAAPAAAVEQPGQRIGAIIRATRENLGYTMEQVSKETRVHLSHLRAIEDMTPNLLGAPVYAKGYIRTYARHLGLDENSTLERYLRECAILKDPEKHTIAPPSTGRRLPVALPVFGFLIIAIVGAAGAFFLMNGGDKTAAPATAAVTPDGAAPAAANPQTAAAGAAETVAPAAQQLRIVAVRRALIEVRSASGDKYVRRYFDPGESYPVRVGYGWTVTAPEDGSAFEWRIGDRSLGLLQTEGGPAYSQSVDIAAKRPPVDAPAAIADETAVAPVDGAITAAPAAPPSAATPAPATRPAGASPAPAGPPGTRPAAAPPSSAAAAPVKPKPKPPAKPETPPAIAATPAPAPAAPPVTPAQDPALLAYPGQ